MRDPQRKPHPVRAPRAIERQIGIIQLDLPNLDRASRPPRRLTLLDERAQVETAGRQVDDIQAQPRDVEAIDHDRIAARHLRHAIVRDQAADTNGHYGALLDDNILEHNARKEIAAQSADREISIDQTVRLPDDQVAGVPLEPRGIEDGNQPEHENEDEQCPVNDDSARQPPYPHAYMLPRGGGTSACPAHGSPPRPVTVRERLAPT